MNPISSFNELLQELQWDNGKRGSERWYIFLLMNPKNQTNAGVDILRNFSYLDIRTGEVSFFLPGFSNGHKGVVPFPSSQGCLIYEDDSFGKIYFDERGFIDTIFWLERGSYPPYKYSEGLDLVIVKYFPRYTASQDKNKYRWNFDLQNLIAYNLDSLKIEGINTIQMITECMRVVSQSKYVWQVKQGLENFIFSKTNQVGGQTRHSHQAINVFVAGAKELRFERDAVISSLTHITNNSSRGYTFRVKSFEDFDRSLSSSGRQAEYNDYISKDAEYAIFILDGRVGGITIEEFNVAMDSYKAYGKPEIFVYSHTQRRGIFSTRISQEIITIKDHLSEIGQYYIEYRDIDDLKNKVAEDFRRYSL